MAMYLFKDKINTYSTNGVDFVNHIYIPEIDQTTNVPQYDHEDHNHVLKRITSSFTTRTHPRC